MERDKRVESLYDFEVVDEWSESDDPGSELESPSHPSNLKDTNELLMKPTEGEIDAFLENVKDIVTSETSGLKAESKSFDQNSTKPNNPARNISSIFIPSSSSKNINFSHNKLNSHSAYDSRVKNNRSTVSSKPGGTHVVAHSVNDDSSPYREQTISSSQYSIPLSLKHVQDGQDDFSDYRDNGLSKGLQRSHIENDLKYRHRRSPEPSRYSEKSIEQSSTSTFPRERFNSRKEMFNERRNREKRRSVDRRREKSRSRSRERRRGRSKGRRTYFSLSPSPTRPPYRRSENEDVKRAVNPVPYYPPPVGPPPHPALGEPTPYYNPTNMGVPVHNVTYPMNQGPMAKYPNYGVGMVHNQPYIYPPIPSQGQGFPGQNYPIQNQQNYGGYGPGHPMPQPKPSEWNRPPIAQYSVVPPYAGSYSQNIGGDISSSNQPPYVGFYSQIKGDTSSIMPPPYVGPYSQIKGDTSSSVPPPCGGSYSQNKGGDMSSSSQPPYVGMYSQIKGDTSSSKSPPSVGSYSQIKGGGSNITLHQPSASWDRQEMKKMLHDLSDSESPPHRKYRRSSTPEYRKSHKRKSKKRSRSPGSHKSRSGSRAEKGPKFPDSYKKKTRKTVIDPARIPTPPPPPILSSEDKSRKRERIEKPLSKIVEKESLRLSCLLEAVMETSGEGKSQLSDPKVKTEILSQCETKIRQLYKRRIAGKGAFIPDPVQARQINYCGSPLITFHPCLSYNQGPQVVLWRCPRIKVPPVKKIDPAECLLRKAAPISTLVSNRPSHPQSSSSIPSTTSGWSGYDTQTTPSFSQPQYSYNSWAGNYNSGGLWEYGTQQPPPQTYQQYNVNTYPLYIPPDSKDLTTYPLKTHSESKYTNKCPLYTPSKSKDVTTYPLRTPSESKDVTTYPLRPPSESKDVTAYPSRPPSESKSKDKPSSHPNLEIINLDEKIKSFPTNIEPPPFNYKREPKRDLLLLAGKRSKKKKKKYTLVDFNSPLIAQSLEISSQENEPADNSSTKSNPKCGSDNEITDLTTDDMSSSDGYHTFKKNDREMGTLDKKYCKKKTDTKTPNSCESSIIEIKSDSEDPKEKNTKESNLNIIPTPNNTNNKLKVEDFIEIGPEIRRIQEKSISYYDIIESLEGGDEGYRRLYEIKNRALFKLDKRLNRLRAVVPRDNLKDLIIILHKRFHNVSQVEIFNSIKDFTFPEIRNVKKFIVKVFSECPLCKLVPSKGEPLVQKIIEKKQVNKTEKKIDTRIDKPKSSVIKRTGGHLKKQDSFTHLSTSSPRYRTKKYNVEQKSTSSDGRPTGYEKATKSRFVSSKTDKNKEDHSESISSTCDIQVKENLVSAVPETKDAYQLQGDLRTELDVPKESESTNEKEEVVERPEEVRRKDEGKPSVGRDAGGDFKTRVRNVQKEVYREIIERLESGENPNDSHDGYLLKGGMLCRKIEGESGIEVKIVAPPSAFEEIINIVHTMSSIHTPTPKVIAFFNKHFTPVDQLQNKVSQFVNNCSECKK